MSSTVDWPSAFLAFSALLGEPYDVAAAAIAPCATEGARALAQRLASGSREARAAAVARVTRDVAAELDVLA